MKKKWIKVFNKAIRSYATDSNKNVGRLIEYAKLMNVEKKTKMVMGMYGCDGKCSGTASKTKQKSVYVNLNLFRSEKMTAQDTTTREAVGSNPSGYAIYMND